MRFVRFTDKNSGKPVEMKGILDGETVHRIHGSFFKNYTVDRGVFSSDAITLLPPVISATVLCVNPSYAKSHSSLAGSGVQVKIPEKLSAVYCLPRAAFVFNDLTNNANGAAALFGVTLMLDFFTDTGCPAAAASFAGYTALGPSINTKPGGETVFYKNGQKVFRSVIPQNEYIRVFEELSPLMKLHAGDIMALPLTETPYQCIRGDALRLAWREDLLETGII